MDYQQQKEINEIQYFLNSFPTKSNTLHRSVESLNSDVQWNAALFFAHILFKSRKSHNRLTNKQLSVFTNKYDNKNKTKIDTESLFKKYWLRNVLGRIFIAGTIDSACRVFNKIKELKIELEFLCHFYSKLKEDERKSISKVNFDEEINKHEIEHGLTLNKKQLYEQQWLNLKEESIELYNLEVHYQPFLNYWDDFSFLNTLKTECINASNDCVISYSDFDSVYNQFASLYPGTPNSNELIKQNVLQKQKNEYLINFFNTEVNYWSDLNEKICGYYWQLLVDKTTEINDLDRVKVFLETIFHAHSSSPRFLDFTTTEAKKYFLNAASQLLIEEPDIIGTENEIEKVRIDGEMSRGVDLLLYYQKSKESTSLNNTDYFELYTSLNLFEKRYQKTLMFGQSSRSELSFLISTLVYNDFETEHEPTGDEDNPKIAHYPRVLGLLKESINKPASLWEIINHIKYNRSQILPYLLVDLNFVSLTFVILDKLEFPEEKAYELKLELWKKCIHLAMLTLSSQTNQSPDLVAEILFQIFRQLNKDKFQIPHNRPNKALYKQYEYQKRNRENIILSLIEEQSISSGRNQAKYLMPIVFNALVKCTISYQEDEVFANNFIRFPLIKWDVFIWLMKCSTYWKYKPQLSENEPEIELLTNSFFKQYLSMIEQDKIETFDIIKQESVIKIVSWSERIENLERLNWLYPIYFFSIQQKLSAFLAPRLYPISADSLYNAENQLIVSKIRTHIAILLQVFRKLINSTVPYGMDKNKLNEIKLRIEQQILDYLTNHIENDPKRGKVDLFDYHSERAYNVSEKELLLPQLTRIINWFSKKEEFVNAFAKNKNIDKILVVAESIASEGIKQKLLTNIQNADLQNFLEKSHWIPEIQSTLLNICQYPELKNKAEEIISFWEDNKLSGRNHDYEKYIFQTKLLLAYHNKDENEINRISEPKNKGIHTVGDPGYYQYKQFYLALLKIKDQPEFAYDIFNDLTKMYPTYPVFALNRMAAKMNLAAEQENDSNLYREVLEEWQVYSNDNKIDEETLGLTFYSNQMLNYYYLCEYELLDKLFVQLDLPDRMSGEVLDTKINSLIERRKVEEALILLEEAETFHKYSQDDKHEFLQILRMRVSGINNIEELKLYYNRILNSNPNNLIKILPEKFNGKIDINEFITKEVAFAANKMLDKINSVSVILNEDKYNDIVQLALESRLSMLGWTVKDQTRRAFSASIDKQEENLGEMDLDIQDCNHNSIITCEAYILWDNKLVQSHVKKLIANYTNKREAFITLVYFKGIHQNFNKKWGEYSNTIVPNLIYPEGFMMNEKSIKDLSESYNQNKSAIKVGRTEHGDGSHLYHIFVNLNYQIK